MRGIEMKRLNWFQNWIARFVGLIDFDFNQAQKDNWRQAKQIGLEEGRKEKPDCLVCPLYKNAHPREIAAYEPPSPTTDGKIEAQRKYIPMICTQHNLPRMHKMTLVEMNDWLL
jgi:hypothetical protein